MFDTREVDRTAGQYTVFEAGEYEAGVEAAAWVEKDWGGELDVSFKVVYQGRHVGYRAWVKHTDEHGRPDESGRRVITELAEACGAIHPGNREPLPADMPGNTVRVTVSKYERKSGPRKGTHANGLDAVAPAVRRGQPAQQEAAQPSQRRGRYDEPEPQGGGGGGSTGEDFDSDIPFIRVAGLPW